MPQGETPREGQLLTGSLFSEPMRVETVRPSGDGTWVLGLVGVQSERFRKVTLRSQDLKTLSIIDTEYRYDGNGQMLRLGLQAYALGIAYEFDPYFGLSISRVDPLPHQLEAVYDYFLKVAEDRRDCYWLYVVTNCATEPIMQEPIKDPAKFPWRKVTKVAHYWLEVNAMTKPMQVREEQSPYGRKES